MLDMLEKESLCYQYFISNSIKNRDQLRLKLKQEPIPGVNQSFIENMFSNFKKSFTLKKADAKKSKQDLYSIICINDLHIPHQDETSLNLAFEFIKQRQPNELILNGDIIDCYWLSKFIKDPKNTEFLQYECDMFYKLFSNLIKFIPNTKVTYISGNHEDRIDLRTKEYPAFNGMECLSLSKLLKFERLNIEYQPLRKIVNGFIFTHGIKAISGSSYSARAELVRHVYNSGLSGHTHRLGVFTASGLTGSKSWFENGCLCKLNPEYISGEPDWQQGFSILYQDGTDTFVNPIYFHNHKFIYNGEVYK